MLAGAHLRRVYRGGHQGAADPDGQPGPGVLVRGVRAGAPADRGNLIYPRVVGSSVGLPAMWVLVAVIAGAAPLALWACWYACRCARYYICAAARWLAAGCVRSKRRRKFRPGTQAEVEDAARLKPGPATGRGGCPRKTSRPRTGKGRASRAAAWTKTCYRAHNQHGY